MRVRRYLGSTPSRTNELLYEALRDQGEIGNIAYELFGGAALEPPRFPNRSIVQDRYEVLRPFPKGPC